MRITNKMFYDRFLSDMQKNMESIFKDNEQISTGKKINRPSDDPIAMSRIVYYKTQISSIGEYKRAIDSAKTSLDALDSSLSSLNNIMVRARELALRGATGTVDANSRLMIANEVDVLLKSAIDIANTKVGDKYIFSGYKSNVAPIDVSNGAFAADSNAVETDISPTVKIGINLPANNLFNDTTSLPGYTDPNFDVPDNGKYVLRALNFLKLSLENNDLNNIQKAIGYIDQASEVVFQTMGEVGARLNKLDAIEKLHDDREFDFNTYLSNDQDADVAKLVSNLTQRQTALEAMRVVSSEFLRTSLFDFIR